MMLETSRKEPGQPWMNSSGMASARGERWWTKCRGTEALDVESGGWTMVVNWRSLATDVSQMFLYKSAVDGQKQFARLRTVD
jgi:hypothetical protein